MAHRRFEFDMPAPADVVFDAFHFHVWRGHSVLIYVYTIEAGPQALRWLLEPVVAWVFARQTQRRFARMRAFLAVHAHEVVEWQRTQHGGGVA